VSTPNIQEALEGFQSRRDPLPKRSSHSFSSPQEGMEAVLSSNEKLIKATLLAARDYVMNEDHLRGRETRENRFPNKLESLGMRIIASRP
jgi:hypothetical protein